MYTHRGKAFGATRRDVYKPQSWISPGTKSAVTLLDFPASRMMRNWCLLFKPPCLWYFITAQPFLFGSLLQTNIKWVTRLTASFGKKKDIFYNYITWNDTLSSYFKHGFFDSFHVTDNMIVCGGNLKKKSMKLLEMSKVTGYKIYINSSYFFIPTMDHWILIF